MKLSENEVNKEIILTNESLENSEINEHIKRKEEVKDKLLPELDIEYLKCIATREIEENVEDVVQKSGLVIMIFTTQKLKDKLNMFM